MANSYLIKEASLVDIANKIRNLTNSENKLTIADISSAIDNEKQNLDAAIAVLIERGIEVPEGATSADLADLINLIEGSGASTFPEFTYTGSYEMVDDGLADDGKTQNWRIKFLTSGKLNFANLGSGKNGIQVFLVGGGGKGGSLKSSSGGAGGGGGGRTLTASYLPIIDTEYSIVIGGSAGATKAFGSTATAGDSGSSSGGGDGGSGGGARGSKGGTNGGDGSSREGEEDNIGYGQGTNTYEFGEKGSTLYSGGGGGGAWGGSSTNYGDAGDETAGSGGNANGEAGIANRGGGGGGGTTGGDGGSGIVIIRNAR